MNNSDNLNLKNFQLGTPSTATVMILDDDHAGIFHFEGVTIFYTTYNIIYNIIYIILYSI